MRLPLLHGALLGAALGVVWSVCEALRLIPVYPYHADLAIWAPMSLGYAVLGAVCGVLGAVVLRWTVPAGLRTAQPGIALAAPVAGLCVAVVLAMIGRVEWMPEDARLMSGTGLLAIGRALAGGVVVHVVILLLGRLRLSWALAPLVAAPTAIGVLVLCELGALVCIVLPQRDALRGAAAVGEAAEAAPNVLLIVLDTVRADHLGCYGYYRDTSPRLDMLAADGVRFANAFAAAPWTLPSHASLFTGLHPTTHGTGWEHPRLHDGTAGVDGVLRYDFPVLAEELAARGYATYGASNKSWIRDQTGLTQGFAEYCDFSQPGLAERFLLARVLRRYQGAPAELAVSREKGGRKIVDATLDWLDGRGSDSAPFFAFLNLNEAHDPYYPPEEFWERFLPEGTSPEDTRPRNLDQSTEHRRAVWEGRADYDAAEIGVLKALYDAEILYQDGLLGELVDGLEDRSLLEDTLIVVTSDHGEEFLETGQRIGHQMSLSDRLIQVPLVMRWPAGLASGRAVDSMASLVDVFPTLLEIAAGEEAPGGPPLEGVSLLDAIAVDGAPVRDMVIAHYDNPASFLASAFPSWDPDAPEEFALADRMRSITVLRSAAEKYSTYGDGMESLVDLLADPLESTAEQPLAEEQAARAALFRKRLLQQLNDHRRRHETVFGYIQAFRAGVPGGGRDDLPLHELGYSTGSEFPTGAADALPPWLGFR